MKQWHLFLQVGTLEGDFDGDVVGLSVVGETVGLLVGGAVLLRHIMMVYGE